MFEEVQQQDEDAVMEDQDDQGLLADVGQEGRE